MNAEFNWWLLIVGLVVGAALVWLVVADSNRREADLLDEELPSEATWISEALADEGVDVEAGTVERILRLHRAYLAVPPPDEPDPELERATPSRARAARERASAPEPAEAADEAGAAGEGEPADDGEPANEPWPAGTSRAP